MERGTGKYTSKMERNGEYQGTKETSKGYHANNNVEIYFLNSIIILDTRLGKLIAISF